MQDEPTQEMTDQTDQSIKALSNDELTKLVLISNRMITRLSSEVLSLQSQLNELSTIILESKIVDSARIQEVAHAIAHGSPVNTPEPVLNLPITPPDKLDMSMIGVSISLSAPVVSKVVTGNENPQEPDSAPLSENKPID